MVVAARMRLEVFNCVIHKGGVSMDGAAESKVSRKQIAIRLLYTFLYLIIFELLKVVVQVTVLFQFIYLLVTREYSEPLKNFSNKVATYAYKLIRYMTLNENERPFPLRDFPREMESASNDVRFE
jgi:hypothetical protein